ncbi:MAG: hypothetical protein KC983_12700, partial [Phycisphaerales bacterium]|nr:hypothetical protein [Phycisphaerales bacterium]
TMSPKLWVVIESLDPDMNVGPDRTGQTMYVCGTVDGSSVTMSRTEFEGSIGAQNVIRMREGLPPLPHPDTVTHYAPGRPSDATAPTPTVPEPTTDPASSP